MTEPEPSDIEIRYKGVPAISPPLAAKRYRLATDTMRKTLARLRAAGEVEPLPEGLDDRTELYLLETLDVAMAVRPGKGLNLRHRKERPMPTLSDDQTLIYGTVYSIFSPYDDLTDDGKERAAREVVTELWLLQARSGDAMMQDLLDMTSTRTIHVQGIAESLRLQGIPVRAIAVNAAVKAVAAHLLKRD